MVYNISSGFRVSSGVSSPLYVPEIPKERQTGGILIRRPGHLNWLLFGAKKQEVSSELLIMTLKVSLETL